MPFLHGLLHLNIVEAKDLTNKDKGGFLRFFHRNKSDSMVSVKVITGGKEIDTIAITRVIQGNLSPKYQEEHHLQLCHESDAINFHVEDVDILKSDTIGTVTIPTQDLIDNDVIEDWFDVTSNNGEKKEGRLKLRLEFEPVESVKARADSEYGPEVPEAVFPLRKGCRVKLYQDAHTPCVAPLTDVMNPDGEPYQPASNWVDTQRAIEQAEKLIYIVGWAVKADMALVRNGEDEESSEDLGELLKRKASEGVRVLVMVWNEALSTDLYPPGMMGTHDEQTQEYFQGTDVQVCLAPRVMDEANIGDRIMVTTTFTHHQKCVIVDAPHDSEEQRRKLVAFVGGIDLTDGRFDTFEHPLYKTIPGNHSRDFYNGICATTKEIGPREPWHDIHMYVEGKAAFDLLANFIERWRCQAEDRTDLLLRVDRDDFDLDYEGSEDDGKLWNTQLFRSINEDSAKFDYEREGKLGSKKGRVFDCSIQRAYVHQIRRAKKFIYIENQYFLGSSHSWEHPMFEAPHLVPMELTARITRAIANGENFRVYICIPMHPEGHPTSSSVQEILHWQHCTVQMMYRKIAKAIEENGVEAHPTDYLSFFCLAKQEGPDEVPESMAEPEEDSIPAKSRKYLRFMIYVHSKMAIFDDEYIIIGSANINERSMSGNRDTELAMGAYQPNYVTEDAGDDVAQGDIHTFRMSLWAEHCGAHLEEHKDPRNIECMTLMRDIGNKHADEYVEDKDPEHSDIHLMLYPYEVAQDGTVTARENFTHFPDTGGSVLGEKSGFLPDTLTT